jgi:WXG100 family type VII secretion target
MPVVHYPEQILDACATMQRAVANLTAQMDDLERQVNSLTGTSSSDAVLAFTEVQQLWKQTGASLNTAMADVSRVADESYNEVTAFDTFLAQQLRG